MPLAHMHMSYEKSHKNHGMKPVPIQRVFTPVRCLESGDLTRDSLACSFYLDRWSYQKHLVSPYDTLVSILICFFRLNTFWFPRYWFQKVYVFN